MNTRAPLFVAMALAVVGRVNAQPAMSPNVTVGQEICTAGYIMDYFCVAQGFLLDAPSVETLKNPELHSVHCLVDVPQCYESPYHILGDPACPGDLYTTGWAVASNERILEAARATGKCDTCEGDSGSVEMGYRGEVRGIVITVDPPVINVTEITHLPEGEMGCTDVPVMEAMCGEMDGTDSDMAANSDMAATTAPASAASAPVAPSAPVAAPVAAAKAPAAAPVSAGAAKASAATGHGLSNMVPVFTLLWVVAVFL